MKELELYKAQTRCISHEIRNHLSICELYSEIIKKRLAQEGIHNDSIENAVKSIQKSLKIIGNSLIDLKSLNNFSITRQNIKTLLENAVEMSTAYICDKDIKIHCSLEDDLYAEIDENKFLACIVNLIKNAIEAIDVKGDIYIKSYVQKNKIHIKVSNTGNAISLEKQKEIFEEGFTTKSTGSGLGLHICKNNLENQNAKLQLVKSDADSTEFEIIMPAV